MKLVKAIEKLDDLIHARAAMAEFDTIDAIKLGIEALKLIQNYRNWGGFSCGEPLPGETEE